MIAYCQYHYYHKEEKALDVRLNRKLYFLACRNVLLCSYDS